MHGLFQCLSVYAPSSCCQFHKWPHWHGRNRLSRNVPAKRMGRDRRKNWLNGVRHMVARTIDATEVQVGLLKIAINASEPLQPPNASSRLSAISSPMVTAPC